MKKMKKFNFRLNDFKKKWRLLNESEKILNQHIEKYTLSVIALTNSTFNFSV